MTVATPINQPLEGLLKKLLSAFGSFCRPSLWSWLFLKKMQKTFAALSNCLDLPHR